MNITEFQESNLIDVARLARDGRKSAWLEENGLMVDFFQHILDNVLPIVKIPGQENLK